MNYFLTTSTKRCHQIFTSLFLITICVGWNSYQDVKAETPNIIVILADDLGYGDPGCYNSESRIPTPHIDRIAKEGMRFTDAHTPSGVCSPTRYGLLTGRYCWRSKLKRGVLWGKSPALIDPNRMTIGKFLQSKGYHTACFGKWHLGFGTAKQADFSKPQDRGPVEAGFDYSYVIPASLDIPPYLWLENNKPVQPPTVEDPGSKRVWAGGNGFWRKGMRSPDFEFDQVLPTVARKSVEYINERSKTEKPFFLYVPFPSPHTPWIPTDEFRGKTPIGAYGDYTYESDWAIGQILEALDKNNIAENTLVIVTSDNGSHWPQNMIKKHTHRANGPWRGQKADIYEGGHRVPFLVRWPGKVKDGAECKQLVCLTDIYATCVEVLKSEIPEKAAEDSFSFAALFTQPDGASKRTSVIHHSSQGKFAIRQGNWKYVDGLGSGGFTKPSNIKPEPGGPTGQLYDLANDPAEQKNLILDQPEVVNKMKVLLQDIRKKKQSR